MKEFNALDYDCPVCQSKKDEWCDKDFLQGLPFAPMEGFTHPQRTEYNLLADQPADGTPASDEQIDNAIKEWGKF